MPIIRIILFMALLLAGGLMLAGWMGISAIARANQEATEGAIAVVLEDVARTLESGARLAIAPAAGSATAARIADARAGLSVLRDVAVLDARGGRLGAARPDTSPDTASASNAPLARIERPVLDDLGAPIATIVATYDATAGHRQMVALARTLIGSGLPVAAILILAAGLVVSRSLKRRQWWPEAPDTSPAADRTLADFDAALARIAAGAEHRRC